MARTFLLTFALSLVVGCGGSAPPPPRRVHRPAAQEPEESTQTTLAALDGTCEPDRSSPVEVGDSGLGTDPTLADERATGWRLARRAERGVIAVACTREPFRGEVSREIDAIETTIGGTPVVLVIDIAECSAPCAGGGSEPCESEVTSAWVLDRDLRLIGAVTDPQGAPAAVENGAIVIGNAKRTLRNGALVAPSP